MTYARTWNEKKNPRKQETKQRKQGRNDAKHVLTDHRGGTISRTAGGKDQKRRWKISREDTIYFTRNVIKVCSK